MLSAGVPLIVVSRQLGHAKPQITATVYAHLLGDSELDRAAGVFEAPDPTRTMRGPCGNHAGTRPSTKHLDG
jgi:hypothetical protein